MYIAICLGLLSFVLCFLFTPAIRLIALRLGLVDKPDGRKKHAVPVPRIGGLGIVLAYAGSLAVFALFQSPVEQLHIQHYMLLRVLLPPAALIFFIGLLDDVLQLTAIQKLTGQVIACTMAAVLGMMYAPESFSFGIGTWIASSQLSVVICAFWLVLCTNAINLIDGLDGLASGIGLLGAAATFFFGLYTHNTGLLVASTPLAGALLAFLFYNFNPASIFLGDCGSLTIGFMLGAMSLTWQHHGGPTLGMFAPICILALPLLDVSMAVLRRYLRHQPLFSPDRGHIHHRMLDRGNQPKKTALLLYCACAVAISLSLLFSVASRNLRLLLVVVFAALLTVAVRYLNYTEFSALRSVLSSRRMRRRVNDEIYLRELDEALKGVHTVDECWQLVEQSCRELHFATVEMHFQSMYFDAVLQADVRERDWWLTLPVGQQGYLRVSRANLLGVGDVVMPALDRLQRGLNRLEGAPTPPVEERPQMTGAAEKSVPSFAERAGART